MVEDKVGHALKKSHSGKKRKSEDPPEENFNIEEFENMTLSEEESDNE